MERINNDLVFWELTVSACYKSGCSMCYLELMMFMLGNHCEIKFGSNGMVTTVFHN